MNGLILDVATAPLANASEFLSDDISAPSNYKDPEKIAAYIADKKAERLAEAALDLDLARLTAVGLFDANGLRIVTAKDEAEERNLLTWTARAITSEDGYARACITYGGLRFDLPMLMRRARYLGVTMPHLSTDRYKSPHIDLCDVLSDRDPSRRRPLGFYVKRLGWTDLVKPLSGAEESRVHETGQWADLEASLRHDVLAAARLAHWAGLVRIKADPLPLEQVS